MDWSHKQETFWDEYFQDFRRSIWGAEASVSLSYTNNGQDCQEILARFAGAVDRCLAWLDGQQAQIFAAVEEDGLYGDAQDAVAEMMEDECWEKAEEDGIAYLLLDYGERIALPYEKADFFRSLSLGGISFSMDFKSDRFIADAFLDITPNVFGGHCIEFFLDGDLSGDRYTVNVNGLAG